MNIIRKGAKPFGAAAEGNYRKVFYIDKKLPNAKMTLEKISKIPVFFSARNFLLPFYDFFE